MKDIGLLGINQNYQTFLLYLELLLDSLNNFIALLENLSELDLFIYLFLDKLMLYTTYSSHMPNFIALALIISDFSEVY